MDRRRGIGAIVIVVLLVGLVIAADRFQGEAPSAAPTAASVAPAEATTTSVRTTTTTTSAPPTTITPKPQVTPTSTSTAPKPGVAGNGRVVVLDPGHNERNGSHATEINQQVDVGNGHKACDTTGTSTNDGYSEASYTTDIAARVRVILSTAGFTVVLTRSASTPWGPCITERAAIGNEAHAAAAVSIHADGGPAGGRGFHVIQPKAVAGHNEAIVEPSHRLALALRAAFETSTGLPRSTYTGTDGLTTRDDLGGLNLSTVPKVFIETANMRNATDAGLLETPAFRQRVAEGIADGIIAFVTG